MITKKLDNLLIEKYNDLTSSQRKIFVVIRNKKSIESDIFPYMGVPRLNILGHCIKNKDDLKRYCPYLSSDELDSAYIAMCEYIQLLKRYEFLKKQEYYFDEVRHNYCRQERIKDFNNNKDSYNYRRRNLYEYHYYVDESLGSKYEQYTQCMNEIEGLSKKIEKAKEKVANIIYNPSFLIALEGKPDSEIKRTFPNVSGKEIEKFRSILPKYIKYYNEFVELDRHIHSTLDQIDQMGKIADLSAFIFGGKVIAGTIDGKPYYGNSETIFGNRSGSANSKIKAIHKYFGEEKVSVQ